MTKRRVGLMSLFFLVVHLALIADVEMAKGSDGLAPESSPQSAVRISDREREAALWRKTGFNFALLSEQVIREDVCLSSDRYYLGCIAALDVVLKNAKPGYKLLSIHHPVPERYTLFQRVGDFVILKFDESSKSRYGSPLQELRALRAQSVRDELVWTQRRRDRTSDGVEQADAGFAQVFEVAKSLIDPREENVVAAYAMNKFNEYFREPHFKFYPAAVREQAKEDETRYSGIGANVEMVDSGARVRRLVPHSPAERAGLVPGDVIVEIDNEATAGKPLGDVLALILESDSNEVRLRVERSSANGGGRFDVVLKKETVVQSHVQGKEVGDLLYIRIDAFEGENLFERFVSQLTENRGRSKAIVIDLRENGGGLLAGVLRVLNLFIPAGEKLVTMVNPYSGRQQDEILSAAEEIFETRPVVVIVDQNSASASELFAGVLQDHARGLVVGARTFGKGTKQRVGMSDMGLGEVLLAETVSRYHLPSGRSPQLRGITPDFEAYRHDPPTDQDLISYREEEIYRFPIASGPFVPQPENPELPGIKSCVESNKAKTIQGYHQSGDYAFHLAQTVAHCSWVRRSGRKDTRRARPERE